MIFPRFLWISTKTLKNAKSELRGFSTRATEEVSGGGIHKNPLRGVKDGYQIPDNFEINYYG